MPPELETIAKLKDKVYGEQSVSVMICQPRIRTYQRLFEDSSVMSPYRSLGFQSKEGRHLQKGNLKKILIHEELAKKNGISASWQAWLTLTVYW